jgi:hypothetical protein
MFESTDSSASCFAPFASFAAGLESTASFSCPLLSRVACLATSIGGRFIWFWSFCCRRAARNNAFPHSYCSSILPLLHSSLYIFVQVFLQIRCACCHHVRSKVPW